MLVFRHYFSIGTACLSFRVEIFKSLLHAVSKYDSVAQTEVYSSILYQKFVGFQFFFMIYPQNLIIQYIFME